MRIEDTSHRSSFNDHDGSRAALTLSIFADLKETKSWNELLREIAFFSLSLTEAMADEDRVRVEIYLSFLGGALDGLLDVELPPEARSRFLEHLEVSVREVLESWDIDLAPDPRSAIK